MSKPWTRASTAHSIVNGLGVLAIASLHLWGSLSAEWAAVSILALCGIWVRATQSGPPGGPPGGAGLVALALATAGHHLRGFPGSLLRLARSVATFALLALALMLIPAVTIFSAKFLVCAMDPCDCEPCAEP